MCYNAFRFSLGNLDRETQREIMEIFRELADSGKCVILVSHSSEVANMCDERYELVKISGKTKKRKKIVPNEEQVESQAH